jgi:hypothetical protein
MVWGGGVDFGSRQTFHVRALGVITVDLDATTATTRCGIKLCD